MIWAVIVLSLALAGASTFAIYVLQQTMRERNGLLQELAQSKLEAASAIADKGRAEMQRETAQLALYEKVLQDNEASQRHLESATASELANALRLKLSPGATRSDLDRADTDGPVTSPMQVDTAADTARLKAASKPG